MSYINSDWKGRPVKIPKISPGAYIFQWHFLRGLSTEGNLSFEIDWASLIVGNKFTVFALFYFVFEGNFPSTSPWGGGGAYIWRGHLGAYIWRGLFAKFYVFRPKGNLQNISSYVQNSFKQLLPFLLFV